MVFDILLGAVLLAFGLLVIFFSTESKEEGSTFLLIVLVGIAAIVGGGWILITKISFATLLTKLAGLILAALGIFLAVEFPDIDQYQREGMSKTGILIGVFLIIFGFYLLIFA
ncbi:MAG: hypothetical protein NT120_02985 [Candidatus Aenigmarchaeota archaeon]|nr:hypothetical protein [Candidatus Aenigmarchaeota archaeon]